MAEDLQKGLKRIGESYNLLATKIKSVLPLINTFNRNVEKWAEKSSQEAAMLSFYDAPNCTAAPQSPGRPNLTIDIYLQFGQCDEEAEQWVKTPSILKM